MSTPRMTKKIHHPKRRMMDEPVTLIPPDLPDSTEDRPL